MRLPPVFEEYIALASRAMATKIEDAVRGLMEAEGLTKRDLRERCTWVTWPDGRNQITLDGVPRLEWFAGVSNSSVAEEGEQ